MLLKNMENINRDELFQIAIMLDLPDLLSFCKSSKRINKTICQKDNIWLYKLNNEFPNYKNIKNKNYKELYIDMLKNSIPKKYDPEKSYNILNLYKAVEKGYNTKREFEDFVNKTTVFNLFVEDDITLYDYISIVEDELGSYEPLNSGHIVIYFSYPEKKVTYGPSSKYYLPENFGIWSK